MHDDDEALPLESDRRGGDGTPAEGRRVYDKPDATIDRVEATLDRIKHVGLAVAFIVSALFGALVWLGYHPGVGPGARTDELQATVDANKAQRTFTDSVISSRLSRLERVVTTMAYQSCVADSKTPRADCTKIFTDEQP